jgi:hypothetical protein
MKSMTPPPVKRDISPAMRVRQLKPLARTPTPPRKPLKSDIEKLLETRERHYTVRVLPRLKRRNSLRAGTEKLNKTPLHINQDKSVPRIVLSKPQNTSGLESDSISSMSNVNSPGSCRSPAPEPKSPTPERDTDKQDDTLGLMP